MQNDGPDDQTNSTMALTQFNVDLMQDLRDLRDGKITLADARVRAQLAREVLRGVSLQLEGMRFLSGKALPSPSPRTEGADNAETAETYGRGGDG